MIAPRHLLLFLVGLAGMVTTETAAAQEDACSIFRDSGLRRTVDLRHREQLDILEISMLKQSSASSSATGGSVKFPVNVGGMILDVTGDYAENRSRMAAIEKYNEFQLSSDKFLSYNLSEGDPNLIGGLLRCLEMQSGLSYSFKKLDSADKVYQLALRWRPGFAQPSAIRLPKKPFATGGTVLNATCDLSGRGKLDETGCTITFTKQDASEDLIVELATEAGTITAVKPGVRRFRFVRRPFANADNSPVKHVLSRPAEGTYCDPSCRPNEGKPRPVEPQFEKILDQNDGWVFDTETVTFDVRVTNGVAASCYETKAAIEPHRISWAGGALPRRGDNSVDCELTISGELIKLEEVKDGKLFTAPDRRGRSVPQTLSSQ